MEQNSIGTNNMIGLKAMIVLAGALGVIALVVAGSCFYWMDYLGLLGFTGFVAAAGVGLACGGAMIVGIRQAKGIY